MALSRDELERLLADLDAAMPAMMAQYPDPGDFNSAFAGVADEITDNTAAADDAWAFEQIDGILKRHGLWQPGQEDLPPDE